jgi:uncharacterized repeat protein (TIGR04076 family)
MTYQVKVTVLDKKLYPELQKQYCANPVSGKCPCFNVGDEFIFRRDDSKDDFWHMGEGTLVKSGKPDQDLANSPDTHHCGSKGVPFCSEAWDAISRYIYSALQGGAIMHEVRVFHVKIFYHRRKENPSFPTIILIESVN